MLQARQKPQEDKEKKDPRKDHHRSRRLSHESATQIMDHEWKHHPGGG